MGMMILINILLGVLALFVVLGVAAMIFFKLTVGRRDSWRKPDEKRFGSGARKALVLYQPSNGRRNVPQAEELARTLAGLGYTVTVNHPSEQADYDLMGFDLLVFGTPVYMGETAKPLHQYIERHPFTGKRVVLFVNGMDMKKTAEVEALKLRIPEGNEISAVKVGVGETGRLLALVREQLGEEMPEGG